MLIVARRLVCLMMAGLLMAVWLQGPAYGGQIYWAFSWDSTAPGVSQRAEIRRADFGGGAFDVILEAKFVSPFSVAVDATGGKLYWADIQRDRIFRTDFDGTGFEVLVDGLQGPRDIALDLNAGKMYWTDRAFGTSIGLDRIQRANLDGTVIEDVIVESIGEDLTLSGLALDPIGGKVYWSDRGSGDRIERANLDGTARETFYSVPSPPGIGGPGSIAVDPASGTVYWIENWQVGTHQPGQIMQLNIDGSGVVEELVTGPGVKFGALCLDPLAGKMYWVSSGDSAIQRANLDGTLQEAVYSSAVGLGTALAVIPQGGGEGIYFAEKSAAGDPNVSSIRRVDLTGANPETLLERGLGGRLGGMVVDESAQKIYWAEGRYYEKIKRANYDGSDPETIVEISTFNIERPSDLRLDLNGGKVYWVGASSIGRANLDGTGIEDLQTGRAGDLALDAAAGHLYWCSQTGNSILRANLDGSNPQSVISTNAPTGLALDLPAGKIYWSSFGSFHRANLDGSNPEFLFSGGPILGFALDIELGQVYWQANDLFRANFDGTGLETLVSGAGGDESVALLFDVPVPLGDCDNSGAVDSNDVPCFVFALLGFDFGGSIERSDVNGDGNTDGADIQPFVDLLIGG